MRVLAINDVARGGGAAALFQRTNRLLSSFGHEVETFTGDLPSVPEAVAPGSPSGPGLKGKLPPWLRSAGAAVLGDMTALRRAVRHVYDPALRRRIESHLAVPRFDVAHVHNLHNRLSPILLKSLSSRGIPIVFQVNDYFAFCNNYAAFNNSLNAPCKRCVGGNALWAAWYGCTSYGNEYSRLVSGAEALRRFVMNAQDPWAAVDLFLVTGEAAEGLMREWGVPAERLFRIRNPVVVGDGGTPGPIGEDIVFYGGFLVHKGTDVFLKALEHLDAGVSVGVYLVGMTEAFGRQLRDVGARRGLKLTVDPGLRWDTGLRDVVSRARAVVVPSRWWVTSENVVYESMLLGRPVLSGNRGGNAELIEEGVTGLLFDPDQPAEMGKLMNRLAGDVVLATRMGAKARERAQSLFSEDVFVGRLLEAYERAVNFRRARKTASN